MLSDALPDSRWSPVILLLVAILLLLALYLMVWGRSKSPDSREPPVIQEKIPGIGHLISLALYGSKYYDQIRARTSLPIYTLRVLGHNIYVVNSPELVSAVDRHAQDFSFAPYLVQFAARALSPSKEAVDKLSENIHGEDGDVGLRIETQKAMRGSMAAGTDTLTEMNNEILRQLCKIVDSSIPQNGESVELFYWVRQMVTVASTNAVYGPGNPFRDSAVADGLWALDKEFAPVVLNWYPKLLAPNGYRGREAVIDGFIEYFKNQRHEEGSALVKARYKANAMYDMSSEDIARFETSLAIALLVNTGPAAFWTLLSVLSDRRLLSDLQQQLEAFVRPEPDSLQAQSESKKGQVLTVDMAQVLGDCPLLTSLFQEVLRVKSTNAAGRMVMRDSMLNAQYLLKANASVLIPSTSVHEDATVWGSTVKGFDPYRFARTQESKGHRTPAYAYRAFGGGAVLCPGRFLASMEILSMIAMVVLRFDVKPVDSTGRAIEWRAPESKSHILTSILSPKKDMRVTLSERERYRGATWRFTINENRVSQVDSL